MTQATSAGAVPAPKSLPARFIGVLTAPRETFQSIAAHPKWFGMFAVTMLLGMFFSALPVTTDEGKQAALDQQITQREAWTGRPVTDQEYQQIQRTMPFAPYFAVGFVLIIGSVMLLVISGILFAVFNAALGGQATFKQVLAVVVSAGAVTTLGTMFTGPLNYFRGAIGSATNLRVLLPMIEEKSFVGRLLGMTDLFIIWWLVVLAIGIAVLYRRRTQPVAISFLGFYALIALVYATVMSGLGG
jgi:Yip1-like protein